MKLHPQESPLAQELLLGFNAHIDEACVGSISEVFDSESPYVARGCCAQAWSVAEVLRCLIKTCQPAPAPAAASSDLVHV